ncbi:uncharacterized protein LOC105848810 [Hydra vulgaris]|uniref:Uncharacterized protein LOC105848810 n=1 Tax=Hydra vulgaris TaxID=6087 RepID=A0ABM4B7G9_HYDVU
MKLLSLLFLAVIASLLLSCPAKKTYKNKVLNRSFLSSLKSLLPDYFSEKQCQATKQKNETPSAARGDSPIKSFGYPDFNINAKSVSLDPKTSLSVISSFKSPINLGVYDFLIAGKPNELQAFFNCFSDYEVNGFILTENGKWEKNKGTIKIQLSNLIKAPKVTESVFEMIFSLGIDKITKYLDPKAIIGQSLFGNPNVLNNIEKIKEAWRLAKKYLPIPDNLVDKVAEICAKDIPLNKKIKEFFNLLKSAQNTLSDFKKQWKGKDNVNRNSKVLVSLTMYSKPENNVRATYDTGKSAIKLKDIGDAVNIFMTKIA